MEPVTLALLALGGYAIVGGKRTPRSRGVKTSGWAVKGQEGRVAVLNEIRGMAFHYSNEFGSMPLLADFLTVTGFRESNFNPAAANPEIKNNPMNAARGLFGMRPETAFKSSNGLRFMRAHPNALLNPRWSFVCAVHHAWQACDKVFSTYGVGTNYAAVRRWWGWPVSKTADGTLLVADFDISDSRSQASLEKLEKAIHDCNRGYGTTMDPDFIWATIQGWQNYPGMGVMLQVYGLEGEAAAAA